MSSEPIYTPRIAEGQSTGNKIIDFNRHRVPTAETIPTSFVDILLSNPTFQSNLKDVVEGIVFRSMFQVTSEASGSNLNPFDALLIIDLKADDLNQKDIRLLKRLSAQIEDRSSEISFADGWDE